jgi:hypothetical protein
MLCKLMLGRKSMEQTLAHTNPSTNIKIIKEKIVPRALFNTGICFLYCLTIHPLIALDAISRKHQITINAGLSGLKSQ